MVAGGLSDDYRGGRGVTEFNWLAGQLGNETVPPFFCQDDDKKSCLAAIRACLTPAEFYGFLKGSCVRQLWQDSHVAGGESLALTTLVQFLQQLHDKQSPP